MKRKRMTSAFLSIFFLVPVAILAQEKKFPINEYGFKGIYNATDVGLLIGSSQNNLKAPFSLMSVTSYHITDKFAAGIGVGVDFLEETYIPLVLDLRYYFRKSKFTPFVFIQGGYNIATEKEIDSRYHEMVLGIISGPWPPWSSLWPVDPEESKPKGGFLINPGIGIRNMFSKHFGVTFSIAYRYHKLSYDLSNGAEFETDQSRLNLRVGVIIK